MELLRNYRGKREEKNEEKGQQSPRLLSHLHKLELVSSVQEWRPPINYNMPHYGAMDQCLLVRSSS